MIKSARQSERASVLIVAVGILVALTLMAVTFATLTRLDLAASTNMDDVLTCRLVARGALEYAEYILWRDMYGTDDVPYSADEGAHRTGGSPYVVDFNDECYDSPWEEWMPGGGLFSMYGSAATYSRGRGNPDPSQNDCDNDGLENTNYTGLGYGGYDSKWLEWPLELPNNQRAQVAILIKDFGAGRLNVNYVCNNDGATTSLYAFTNPRYATAISATSSGGIPNLEALPLMRIVRARQGGDDLANEQGGATTKSWAFLPYNPQGDSDAIRDKPFGAFDAAELIWGTQSDARLEAAFDAAGYTCTSLTAQYLTPWSADTMWPPYDSTKGQAYRRSVNTLTAAQLVQIKSGAEYSWWDDAKISDGDANKWTQFIANLVDYRDSDNDVTTVSGYYGLEPHPYISELYSASGGVGTASNEVYRIELYNPFGHAVSVSDFAVDFEFQFSFEQDAATTNDSPIARTLQGVVDLSSVTDSIPAGGYATLGNNKTNGDVGNLPDVNLDGKVTWTINPPRSSVINGGSELMTSRADFTGNKFKLYFDNCKVVLKRRTAPQVIVDQAKQTVVPDHKHTYNGAGADPTLATNESLQRERYNIEESSNWIKEGTNDSMGAEYPSAKDTIKLTVAQSEIYSLGQLSDMMFLGYDTDSTNASYTDDVEWIDACKEAGKNNPNQTKLDAVFFNPVTAADVFQFFDTFTTESPQTNGKDDDGDGISDSNDDVGQTDDVGGPEIQMPGRVNINTAPATVLSHLPAYWDASVGQWKTLGEITVSGKTLAEHIVSDRQGPGTGKPYRTISDLLVQVNKFLYKGATNVDDDGDGLKDDEREQAQVFRTIANLITTRSNVFVVYITARIIEDPLTDGIDNDADGTTDEATEYDDVLALNHAAGAEKNAADRALNIVSQQKLVAVVDRSTKPITVRFFRWANESWEAWQN